MNDINPRLDRNNYVLPAFLTVQYVVHPAVMRTRRSWRRRRIRPPLQRDEGVAVVVVRLLLLLRGRRGV